MGALKLDQTYTYADYLSWGDDERWELVSGIPYALAAPNPEHQRILGRLFMQFASYLEAKECEVFIAPFDVVLADPKANDQDKMNVVQPDLTIVCNPQKITDRGCEGTPDIIIEVLSPGTYKKDLNDKFDLYESSGVKEYWIVAPGESSVIIYLLDKDGKFKESGIFTKSAKVNVNNLPGLAVDLEKVFIS